jgi:hypothetical protein
MCKFYKSSAADFSGFFQSAEQWLITGKKGFTRHTIAKRCLTHCYSIGANRQKSGTALSHLLVNTETRLCFVTILGCLFSLVEGYKNFER